MVFILSNYIFFHLNMSNLFLLMCTHKINTSNIFSMNKAYVITHFWVIPKIQFFLPKIKKYIFGVKKTKTNPKK
jgi:hypothetical protein